MPYRKIHSNGNPLRILDLLDIDGGWWQAHELADRFDISRATAERALQRLRDRGLVESRPVWRVPPPGQPLEWRITDEARELVA